MARLFSHRPAPSRMGSRGQPEESRAAILQAAAKEFAEHGIAGARTDAIARQAGVNKALLYYYFKDKETLYGAVLDDAFSGLKTTVFRVLDSELQPREKIIAYAGAYFDFIASNQLYPRLMQQIVGFNPLTPDRIAERRAAVLDFISAALFRPKKPTPGARP